MENKIPASRFIRKQYLIKTKFQLSYVGLILTLMIITACICSYVVYYTSIITLGEKLAAVYPQGRVISIVNMVNMRILFSIIIITPFIIIIGIYFSHKIAGPIFRIERFLRNMAAGDLSERLSLRKGDELVSLADGINGVRESIAGLVDSQKERLDGLAGEIAELKNTLPPGLKGQDNIIEIMSNIDSDIRNIKAGLDKYKLRK